MNKKGNQGFQQTHQRIMNTMMKLLQTKTFRQITVAEICRNVEINRSTFYEHFVDTYELLRKMTEAPVNALTEIFKKYDEMDVQSILIAVFNHVKENAGFYKIIMDQGIQLPTFSNLTANDYTKSISSQLSNSESIEKLYHDVFFKAGMNSVIYQWLNRDCLESPEVLYNMLLNFGFLPQTDKW